MCEGNMNMAICILMGLLLLIVIWYVFMGNKKESFESVTVSNGEHSVTRTGNIDPLDLTYRALQGGVALAPNAIATPVLGPNVVPGTAVRADARNPYI